MEIYQSPEVEKFMVKYLRMALSPEDLAILEEYETFKGQHGQTDEQKATKGQAANISLKLSRWYVKIGYSIWPPAELSTVLPPAAKAEPPSGNLKSLIVQFHILMFHFLGSKKNPRTPSLSTDTKPDEPESVPERRATRSAALKLPAQG